MISKEQFIGWKENPVTKEIFNGLEQIKKELIVQMSFGSTIGHNAEETHGFTNRIIGKLDGINQLLGISHESIDNQEDIKDNNGY